MEAKESTPRLDVQEILPSLGVFGDAMSTTSSSSQNDSESFVERLVLSTNDLVEQLDQLNDNIVKQFDSSERLLREELFEQKSKERPNESLAYNSSFKEMNIILEEMKKTMEELLELTENGLSDLSDNDLDIDDNRRRGRRGRGGRLGRLGRLGRFITRPLAAIGTTAAIGIGGAVAFTGAAVVGLNAGAEQIYAEGSEPLKMLENQYGMKAIKNKDGHFIEAYEINGKRYPANKIPKEYQTLLDAYGPTARPGDGRTNAALKAIKDNPQIYESLKTNQPKYDAATQKAIDKFNDGGGDFGGGGASAPYITPNALSPTDTQKMFPEQFAASQAQTPLAQNLVTGAAMANAAKPEYSTIEPEMTVTSKRINEIAKPEYSTIKAETPVAAKINELLKPEIATTNLNQTLNTVNQTQSMLANSPIMNSESDESIQTRLEKSSEFSDVMMKSATSNFSEQMSSKIEEYTRTVDKMESSTITAPPIIMGNSGGASQAAPLSPSLSSFQSMGIIGTDEVPDPNYFGGSLELELMI